MLLYHGSARNIAKTLKPHRAFDREDYSPAIYFSDKKEIALLYAISPINTYIKKNFNIDIHCSATSAHICDLRNPLTVVELYPNMFEDIYHQNAFIYVSEIDEKELGNNGGSYYTINKDVDFIDKIEILDVFSELLKLKEQKIIKLLPFNKLDKWDTYFEYEHIITNLQTRKHYCKTDEEKQFFQMVSKYFPSINHD